MNFELTDDQRSVQEAAARYARERLAPGYQSRERENRIDRALVREMGELGLIAPELPEHYGGLGAAGSSTASTGASVFSKTSAKCFSNGTAGPSTA